MGALWLALRVNGKGSMPCWGAGSSASPPTPRISRWRSLPSTRPSSSGALAAKPVYNDKGEKIGAVEDLIITPDKAVSHAIIGVGGFAGLGKHDVAIPMTQFASQNNRFVLPAATKEALKALPRFEYAKAQAK